MKKLTENQVVDYLSDWLVAHGWTIEEKSKDHNRGLDLKASKGPHTIIVEAKGARGNPRSHVTTRSKFTCGQIKDHFGKAIVKILEERHQHPDLTFGIAQPDDEDMRRCLKKAIPEMNKIGIKLFWVRSASQVIEE